MQRMLIVGSGGREHALAWSLAQATPPPRLFIAPGNPGTRLLGQNVPLAATDITGLVAFARQEAIDLVIVGPEQPLVLGLVDALAAAGIAAVGPTAAAARLEGSKAFAKAFMQRHAIPTAASRTFTRQAYAAARAYLEAQGVPVVVKASGLAAGKGAVVCQTEAEAREALDAMLRDQTFGEAGDEVVIEAFMEGEEASLFVLTDGTHYHLLAPAQDHKRVGDGDTGPNTGGMGAYAPAPVVTAALGEAVRTQIVEPTLSGMAAERCPFQGVLYVGLMVTAAGPKVVEYNCRWGDPEAQVVLPLLQNTNVLFEALAHGRLRTVPVTPAAGAAACVVMAAPGYPGAYPKGAVIGGLEAASAEEGVLVFHAGTALNAAGVVVTAGGRVLGITGLGQDLPDALARAYRGVAHIRFEGQQYRRDIGLKGLARLAGS